LKGLLLVICFFISAFLLIGGNPYQDFPYWHEDIILSIGPVSVRKAKQSINQWSGRQNLIIELMPVNHWETPGIERVPTGGFVPGGHLLPYHTFLYAFDVNDPNPDLKYEAGIYVDSYTAKVVKLIKGFPTLRDDKNIANMLTPQQAINRAKELLLSYFPNVPVDSLAVKILQPETTQDGSSWKSYDDMVSIRFYNRTFTSEGEEIYINLQSASVTFDSNNGELLLLRCGYEPLKISPIPDLTKPEIAQIVTSYMYGLGAETAEVTYIDKDWFLAREEPYGAQRLYVEVFVAVEPSEDLPVEIKDVLCTPVTCWVDGHTGEVFYAIHEVLMGGGSPAKASRHRSEKEQRQLPFVVVFNGLAMKAKPPLIKGGEIYIALEDLEKMGFALEKKDNGFVIKNKDKSAKLESKDVLEKGQRKYIRGGAIGKLKDVITRYAKEENKFHILIINKKAFRMGEKQRYKLKHLI
jgi:hypothetical protein